MTAAVSSSEFDAALASKDFQRARVISGELQQNLEKRGSFVELSKLGFRQLGIPQHERLATLDSQMPLDSRARNELDTLYVHTADFLEKALNQRRELLDTGRLSKRNLDRSRRLSGIMSELTVFGLLARDGAESMYIPLPASEAEDSSAPYAKTNGDKSGVDMRVIPAYDLTKKVELQIKTGEHFDPRYLGHITIVSLRYISSLLEDGVRDLPRAVIDDARSDGTRSTRNSVLGAYKLLTNKINDGIHSR